MDEWTTAISFVGRCYKVPTATDMALCLDLWNEMEHKYAVKSGLVTFNVLIDIAIKTRKWHLVNVFRSEMSRRKIQMDRYTFTSLIYYYGLRGNGDEVRRLYKEMTLRGEVVDIVVINCVMTSLIKAGEAEAAEHIYARLKRLAHITDVCSQAPYVIASGTQPQKAYQNRAIANRVKMRRGEILTDEDIAPDAGSLCPDTVTFNMLIQYHCRVSGDLQRVSALLEEMQQFGVCDSSATFISLFEGFALFGTAVGSDWTAGRLDHVLDTLLQQDRRIRISQTLTRTVLRAYAKTATQDRVIDVWRQLDRAWQKQGGIATKRSTNISSDLALMSASHGKAPDFRDQAVA